MSTVIDFPYRDNFDRHPLWDRFERADLFEQYLDLQAQGVSQRQASKKLKVPRTTLQAWQAHQESLDEHPAVVAFFQSSPGLAFLHRLVLGLHLVMTEVGACGIRLVCLLLQLTGLDRFVGASYGSQQQVNVKVEEAIVAYRQEETARLAKDMPRKDITVTHSASTNRVRSCITTFLWWTLLSCTYILRIIPQREKLVNTLGSIGCQRFQIDEHTAQT